MTNAPGFSAAGALAQFGEIAVDSLMGALESKSMEERAAAAQALAGIGMGAAERLLSQLHSEGKAGRDGAAWALGQMGASDAAPDLIAHTADQDQLVGNAALSALVTLGGEAVVELVSAVQSGRCGGSTRRSPCAGPHRGHQSRRPAA